MNGRPGQLITLLVSGGMFLSCWQLPNNFSSLTLRNKINTYEVHFKHGGARDYDAEELISAHGYSAAEAMVPYILKRSGIPPFVAINIVWDVQSRGCDLRGSAAVEAMKKLLTAGNAQADERIAAQAALRAITNIRHSAPASMQLSGEVCRPK